MKSMNMWVWLPVLLLGCGLRLRAADLLLPEVVGSYTLELATHYTTNLIFPFAITGVDLGSGDIIAKKMGRTENVLLVKAAKVNFAPTNISVYLENGRLYSFRVRYADSLTELNYLFRADSGSADKTSPVSSSPKVKFTGQPVDNQQLKETAQKIVTEKPFLRVRAEHRGVRLALRGVYLKDGLVWLSLKADNRSAIEFRPDLLRCSLEDVRRLRRTAEQSIELKPVFGHTGDALAGGSREKWAIGFSPFTVGRGKTFVVEWGDSRDYRRVRLAIGGRHILKARNLNTER